jgi:ribokinase
VGEDVFAAQAAAFHKAEGIDAHFVVKPGHPTGTAGILVNAAGQNEIVVAPGANAAIRPDDVPERLIRGARIVVCQHEATLAVNARAFALARKTGALTVLNPAPMRADFDARILASTDVLVPNETEFAALAAHLPACRHLARRGTPAAMPPRAMHAIARAMGPAAVIVTLGARGCLVSQLDGYFCLPAFGAIRVVDTTGAGDAFVGGFAAGWVRFGDIRRAAQYATAVAALSVTKAGTAPSMPRKTEVARFLRRRAIPVARRRRRA